MTDEITMSYLQPDGREVFDAVAFPAADRRAVRAHRAVRASTAVSVTQAVCFYHGTLQAEAACEDCGCYLCALCALPVGVRTVCPSCVVNGRQGKGGWSGLAESRPLWGARAFGIALLSLLLPPLWFLLPVISIGVLIMVGKYWGAPGSLVRPGRRHLIWAGVLAGIGLVAGLAFWWMLWGDSVIDSN